MQISAALEFLDNCNPPEDAWRDSEWVGFISCLMLLSIHRRCGQKLIDAGFGVEYPEAKIYS